jgi:hypothetical protein
MAEGKTNEDYCSVYCGLVCLKTTVKEMMKAHSEHNKSEIEIRKEKESKDEIIKYELANHEAYYTEDIRDTVKALKYYGYTVEDIEKVYNENKGKRC